MSTLTMTGQDSWQGFARQAFEVGGHKGWVVEPATAATGRPWIWRTRFFNAWPGADLALLAQGYHLVSSEVADLYGAPVELALLEVVYAEAVARYQLAPQPVLEGFSRGGLSSLHWAIAHPDRTGGLYLDAPVCDIRSWPGNLGTGPGSAGDWAKCLAAYGLAAETAPAWVPPYDRLVPLAQARIPILIVAGDADRTVPWTENGARLAASARRLGIAVEVILKPGCDHHPHSLEDVTPIVRFVTALRM